MRPRIRFNGTTWTVHNGQELIAAYANPTHLHAHLNRIHARQRARDDTYITRIRAALDRMETK